MTDKGIYTAYAVADWSHPIARVDYWTAVAFDGVVRRWGTADAFASQTFKPSLYDRLNTVCADAYPIGATDSRQCICADHTAAEYKEVYGHSVAKGCNLKRNTWTLTGVSGPGEGCDT